MTHCNGKGGRGAGNLRNKFIKKKIEKVNLKPHMLVSPTNVHPKREQRKIRTKRKENKKKKKQVYHRSGSVTKNLTPSEDRCHASTGKGGAFGVYMSDT